MTQLSLNLSRAHANQQLFSNHFLERRLRDDELWEEVAAEAEEVRAILRARLDEQAGVLDGANEPQTEERWIKPVLRALGWGFEVQPLSQRQGAIQFPDYALFPTQSEADAAAAAGERRQVLKRALGVLEAKRWRRPLDRGGPGEDGPYGRAPSAQIINYLVRAGQPWGILTNGADWRIYYRDADFADTVYFAVDLPALLDGRTLAVGEAGERIPSAEAFRYFYLFFRPEAFRRGPTGDRWLDSARQASVSYARAVEDALKPRAYRAVTALCRGFVAAQALDAGELTRDPARARELLDNALTLLFRLLFSAYAEARDLLPVRTNAAYRNKSLLSLRQRAARIRDVPEAVFPRGRDLWSDLHDLFEIIDGEPHWRDVGIPVYNGGLFDPEKHAWLEDNYVADPQLAEALDLLSRTDDPDSGGLHFIDYSPLDVRHLGSIYEGLLEHVLRVADTDLPVIREGGMVVRDIVRRGELYLANEKGERRTTGSYYTPDYVVQYIVSRTLGPLVEGRTVPEILSLRVLDPAMGSGHFLVAATAYLARAAVRAVEEAPQQLLGEFARLDPDHLSRLVVERCIFGVDKNPRAVELAKLALWLATVQLDRPLNFLDHHLKCGDSLLGAFDIHELGGLPGRKGREAALEAAGQYNAFEGAFRQQVFRVVSFIESIEALPSETVADIERKEDLYGQADAMLQRFRDVADLWTASLLQSDTTPGEQRIDGDRYTRALDALRAPEQAWNELREEPWVQNAKRLWREHRFFHWQVELGEAFFGDRGQSLANPGFDAVLGNPPYVRMEEFKQTKDFLRDRYRAHASRADLYVYFMERSLALLKEKGEYGVIVSNKFLRGNYGRPLRKLLAEEAAVREIVDLGGLPVFPEATVRAAILSVRRGRSDEITPRFAELSSLDVEEFAAEVDRRAIPVDTGALGRDEWVLASGTTAILLGKVAEQSVRLGELVHGQIFWGNQDGAERGIHHRRRDPRAADPGRPSERRGHQTAGDREPDPGIPHRAAGSLASLSATRHGHHSVSGRGGVSHALQRAAGSTSHAPGMVRVAAATGSLQGVLRGAEDRLSGNRRGLPLRL